MTAPVAVLLVGITGSGKTVLAQALAEQCLVVAGQEVVDGGAGLISRSRVASGGSHAALGGCSTAMTC